MYVYINRYTSVAPCPYIDACMLHAHALTFIPESRQGRHACIRARTHTIHARAHTDKRAAQNTQPEASSLKQYARVRVP